MSRVELIEMACMGKFLLYSEDLEAIQGTISDIMGIADTINDVDLSGYDCSDEAVISELREDVVKPSLPVELVLSDAAEKRDNFFTV